MAATIQTSDMGEGGLASRLRGLGPIGVFAALIIVGANLALAPVGAILALVWAWLAKLPLAELGLRRPRSWVVTLLVGLVGGILFKLLMKALVMPLLGAPAVNAHFHFIAGNRAQLISMILASIIVAGFGEEIVYRGFVFERLWRAFGRSTIATAAIIVATSIFFGSIHIPEQGFPGAEQAFITGLAFGTIYAVTRSLWMPIVMHAAFDVTAVFLIYLRLEETVAHAILG
jgi:membrane protease YdiL (CAAX protease family)